jgi:hypothetical protein
MAISTSTAPDFSLTRGGPLYHLYIRSGLARPPFTFSRARLVGLILLLWLPLAVLSIATHRFAAGTDVPFLMDLQVQIRLLLALPLLIAAEPWAEDWLKGNVRQFVERGLVPPAQRERFESIVNSALRLKDSRWAELVVLVVAITLGHWFWSQRMLTPHDSWFLAADGSRRLPAYWYVFVTLPVFRFLLLRWYYRLIIWCRFMWQIARMPLTLNALHPDRAAGLGFLSRTVRAFEMVFAAHSLLLAGSIGNAIWHEGAHLPDFKVEIASTVIVLTIIAVLPLTFFMPKLVQAERKATREYGAFASDYVNRFRERWLGSAERHDPLGAQDIQSLSDLINSFRSIRETRSIPFTRKAMIELLVVILGPLLPLLLTIVPLEELLNRLAKMLL